MRLMQKKHCSQCGAELPPDNLATFAGRCEKCYWAHNPENDPREEDLPRLGQRAGLWPWNRRYV